MKACFSPVAGILLVESPRVNIVTGGTGFSPVAGILLVESLRFDCDCLDALPVSVPLPGFY